MFISDSTLIWDVHGNFQPLHITHIYLHVLYFNRTLDLYHDVDNSSHHNL